MASLAGPVFWCHQCHVQTQPPPGGVLLCMFCNGRFIEEMEGAEVEPGIAMSSLPLALNSVIRMPSPVSAGTSELRPNSSGPQSHRPRLLSRSSSNVPLLLDAMMAVMSRFESSASPDLPDNDTDQAMHDGPLTFLPPHPMLIVHGGMPNGSGRLQVLIDNGPGLVPELLPDYVGEHFLGQDLDRLIQLLSENDNNRYGTPPAAKSSVEALPRFKLQQEDMELDVLQCAVCKDDVEVGVEVQKMPCKHIYHPDCILPWLAQHNSCPVCRFELPTDDADYEARKNQGNARFQQSGPAPESEQRQESRRVDNSEVPQYFALWGMPGFGDDLSNLSNSARVARESMANSNGGETNESRGSTSVPMHWLFRLFSSGSPPAPRGTEQE